KTEPSEKTTAKTVKESIEEELDKLRSKPVENTAREWQDKIDKMSEDELLEVINSQKPDSAEFNLAMDKLGQGSVAEAKGILSETEQAAVVSADVLDSAEKQLEVGEKQSGELPNKELTSKPSKQTASLEDKQNWNTVASGEEKGTKKDGIRESFLKKLLSNVGRGAKEKKDNELTAKLFKQPAAFEIPPPSVNEVRMDSEKELEYWKRQEEVNTTEKYFKKVASEEKKDSEFDEVVSLSRSSGIEKPTPAEENRKEAPITSELVNDSEEVVNEEAKDILAAAETEPVVKGSESLRNRLLWADSRGGFKGSEKSRVGEPRINKETPETAKETDEEAAEPTPEDEIFQAAEATIESTDNKEAKPTAEENSADDLASSRKQPLETRFKRVFDLSDDSEDGESNESNSVSFRRNQPFYDSRFERIFDLSASFWNKDRKEEIKSASKGENAADQKLQKNTTKFPENSKNKASKAVNKNKETPPADSKEKTVNRDKWHYEKDPTTAELEYFKKGALAEAEYFKNHENQKGIRKSRMAQSRVSRFGNFFTNIVGRVSGLKFVVDMGRWMFKKDGDIHDYLHQRKTVKDKKTEISDLANQLFESVAEYKQFKKNNSQWSPELDAINKRFISKHRLLKSKLVELQVGFQDYKEAIRPEHENRGEDEKKAKDSRRLASTRELLTRAEVLEMKKLLSSSIMNRAKGIEGVDQERSMRTKEVLDAYLTTKIKGISLVKDFLNAGIMTLIPPPISLSIRAFMYGGTSLAEIIQKAAINKQRRKGTKEWKDKQSEAIENYRGEIRGGDDKYRESMKRLKASSELTPEERALRNNNARKYYIAAAVQTIKRNWRALRHKGYDEKSQTKNRDFLEALGKVATAAGITMTGYNFSVDDVIAGMESGSLGIHTENYSLAFKRIVNPFGLFGGDDGPQEIGRSSNLERSTVTTESSIIEHSVEGLAGGSGNGGVENTREQLRDFAREHALLYADDAGFEVENKQLGNKWTAEVRTKIGVGGSYKYLDQALRRLVVDNMSLPKEFSVMDAARAENALANMRELVQGNSVGGFEPAKVREFV
ncbi:MAG: hypothetical protein NUV82_02605, partial [Candidatus Komeilibacteria bacterium]|nr:hypothetical protein [Candidatus Komeilibacteria bacterium]